ncbi:MAG: hypothetical protein JW869_03610 [Candidatus Omnitrophica bacterium]|nr:hypothetical protein [Candidatus Omnitrophota bacterium]
MKKIIGAVLKIIAVFFMLVFLCNDFCRDAWSQTEESSLESGRVVFVDLNKGFVVIDLGKAHGIETDTFFEIRRKNEKIGLVKTVKVREKFSAADVKATYKNNIIKVGDVLELPKQEISVEAKKQKDFMEDHLSPVFALAEKYYQEGKYLEAEDKINEIFELDPANEKAVQMLGKIREAFLQERLEPHFVEAQGYYDEMKYKQAEEKVKDILDIDSDNEEALEMLKNIREDMKMEKEGLEAKVVKIDINASKDSILSKTIDVFREYGCMITFSDPATHNLEASKYIKLPILKQILSEYGAHLKSKVYYSVEIQSLSAAAVVDNRLVIHLYGAYDSKGQMKRHEIKRNSSVYKETEKMAFTIKNLAEKF